MKYKKIFEGFCFGMLLQIAIGPVCIFIFQSAITLGFAEAFKGVLGVTFTDGSEIVLAILGTAVLLEKVPSMKKFFGIFSSVIVLCFGINAVVSSFTPTPLTYVLKENMFISAVVLAASNPLTILFWTGVFTSRISDGKMERGDMWLFGRGCALSTITFLTFVSAVGSVIAVTIPRMLIEVLNIASGLFICGFAVRNIYRAVKE